MPGGFIGVDVFFVLSGFLITSLLQHELRSTGSVSLRTFFTRRVRRLLPMLAITVSTTAALGVFLLSPLGASETTAKTAASATLINANTFLQRQAEDYFGLKPEANALLHTWSLSVEEQFYLVFPVMIILAAALRRRLRVGRSLWYILAVFGIGTSLLLYAALLNGMFGAALRSLGFASPESMGFYSAPSRAWEFLAGAVLALGAARLRNVPRLALESAGILGIILVVGASALFNEADGFVAHRMAIPVAGTLLLLGSGVARNRVQSHLLEFRPLVWIGDRSYGWYLLHWPLIVFAASNFGGRPAMAAGALGGLGLAAAAKPLVEDRIRLNSSINGARALTLAALCFTVPLVVSIGAIFTARGLEIDELTRANERHVDSTNCNRRQSRDLQLDHELCTWPAKASRGRIVLLGDSHASMWSEAVIGAGNRLGYDVSIATMSGCAPLASLLEDRDGKPDLECRRFMDNAHRELLRLRPNLVILGSANVVRRANPVTASGLGTLPADLEPLSGEALLEGSLTNYIEPLSQAGIPVAVMHDVPYHEFTNAECSWLRFRISPSGCASVRSRYDVDQDLAPARRWELGAVERVPSATTFDPVPWLCSASNCSTFGRGTWLYRDGDHISVEASVALIPEMTDAIRTSGIR